MEHIQKPEKLNVLYYVVLTKRLDENDYLIGSVSRSGQRFRYRNLGLANCSMSHAQACIEGIKNIVATIPEGRDAVILLSDRTLLAVLNKTVASKPGWLQTAVEKIREEISKRGLKVRYQLGSLKDMGHTHLPEGFWE